MRAFGQNPAQTEIKHLAMLREESGKSQAARGGESGGPLRKGPSSRGAPLIPPFTQQHSAKRPRRARPRAGARRGPRAPGGCAAGVGGRRAPWSPQSSLRVPEGQGGPRGDLHSEVQGLGKIPPPESSVLLPRPPLLLLGGPDLHRHPGSGWGTPCACAPQRCLEGPQRLREPFRLRETEET